MQTVLITYRVKYQLDFAAHYKWLENNQCYNAKSGRLIRQVLVGGSIGYCINGKFRSLKYLRKHLEKPEKFELPF